MKIRKEQFLLPKVKPIISTGAKWIQPSIKPKETLSPSSASTITKLGDGLPTALLPKVKHDFVLPNGEILVTGHAGTPLIWQQQNGILRQALLSSEKDGKLEGPRVLDVETLNSQNDGCIISRVATNANLVAITAVNAQQFTSLSSSSQVVKMNDYQVILSSDNLPTSWQENGKNNNIPLTTLPPVPKPDTSSFVITNNQMALTSFSNVNVINQNQFQTIMVDNRKPSFTPLTPIQRTPVKKIAIRPLGRSKLRRKQPTQLKKILLKPTSSLLSQTALECRNNALQADTGKDDSKRKPQAVRLESKIEPETNFIVDSPIKSLTPVDNSLEVEPNMIITVPNSESLSCEVTKPPSDDYSQVVLPVKIGEFIPSNTTEQPMTNKSISIVPNSCFDQSEVLTDDVGEVSVVSGEVSVISGNVLIDSNTEVTCIDDHNLLHTEIVHNSCGLQNSISPAQVLRNDVYNRHSITETILPSDIEHHSEHHTEEYTDNLLSQLSNSRVLPNMSCSQVSSVLNALGHTEKTNMTDGTSISKESKEQLKCEPTEFVKVESSQAIIFNKMKIKPKFRECELNKHVCFRCTECMFLSQKSEVVERHWTEEHQSSRSPSSKRTIACLGCSNVFHSKYSLQIHLVCDHNVNVTEVQDLINFTIAANKVPKELRNQNFQEPDTLAEEARTFTVPNTSLTVDVTLTSTRLSCCSPKVDSIITQTSVPFLGDTDIVQLQDQPKLDEDKQDSPLIPCTPSFSLFSDIDLPADKEVVVTTEYSSVDMDGNHLATEEKSCENVQSYKNLRSKLKSEYGSNIKFNYRCMVERCGVRLSSDVNLHYHLRCHKPEMDTLFCPECEVCFTNWPTLTLHLWREHKINMDLYSCIHCHYKTNSFSKLLNNHVKIHGDRKDYICNICNKGFKTGKQLRNHKVIHRVRKRYDIEGESLENDTLEKFGFDYKCNICNRSFTDSRILKLHTENVHNKARPYLCTFCNHTASSKSSLRMHIRQHTGEKPFSCSECEYITGDHNSLRRHKMRHSGRRPYQCPHCPYSCIQATTYKVHLKSKHPGLDEGLMFSCSMCPFRTVKKDNYMAHKAEHDLGGDPRNRRKKHPPSEVIQIETGEFIMPPEN